MRLPNLRFPLTPVVLVAAALLLAPACRTASPAAEEEISPSTTETTEGSQTSREESSLRELFAPQTAVVTSFEPRALDELSAQFPIMELALSPFWGAEPVLDALRDVLVYQSALGVDPSRKVYLGLALQGQSKFFDAVHYGGVLPLEQNSAVLHLRTLIPTEEPQELSRALMKKCEERAEGTCREFVSLSIAGGKEKWVIVDQALNPLTLGFSEAIDEEFLARGLSGLEDSTAWRAFEASEAPLDIYLQFRDLHDLNALVDANVAALFADLGQEEVRELYRTRASLEITAAQVMNTPDRLEIADATFSLRSEDRSLVVDGIGTLTERGVFLANALNNLPNRALHVPSLQRMAFDFGWNLNLHEAVEASALPHWAQAALEESEVRAGLFLLQERSSAMAALAMTSPVSALSIHRALFREETTPKDIALIQGFRFQVGLPDQGREANSAMSLRVVGAEELKSYNDFVMVALLPFSMERQLTQIETGSEAYFKGTGTSSIDDTFGEDPEDGEWGMSAHLRLDHLRGLQRLLDGDRDQMELRPSADLFDFAALLLPLTAFLPAESQEVHLIGGLSEGQALFRGSLGSTQDRLPQAFEEATSAPAFAAHSQCRQEVALFALKMVPQSKEALLSEFGETMAAGLEAIAQGCSEQEKAKVLKGAESWRALSQE